MDLTLPALHSVSLQLLTKSKLAFVLLLMCCICSQTQAIVPNRAPSKILDPPAPTLSYPGPKTYATGAAISPLAPVSSGVGVAGYSSATTAIGSVFSGATGVATDAAGNIYVADSGNSTVKKMSADGTNVVELGSGWAFPSGVAVDAAGNVYVADQGNHVVKKIAAGQNTPVIIGGVFKSPATVAVDAAGNVYVADIHNHLATKIAADGTATIIASVIGLTDVVPDNAGNVYFASFYGLQKMARNSFSPVPVNTGSNVPYQLVFDVAGNLYYTDFSNNSAMEMPANGSAAISIGSGYVNPMGIAVYAGKVYVANYHTGDVLEIDPVGGYYSSTPLPAGLSLDVVTGVITGAPTVAATAKDYIITAYSATKSVQATINLSFVKPTPGPLPTVNASNVLFSNTGTTNTTISWTNGNGTGRAVFISNGTSGSALPDYAVTYAADPLYGSGNQIGNTGWYCIYDGTGSSIDVQRLSEGGTYRVTVVEYDGAPGAQNYLTTGLNPANVTTRTIVPTVPAGPVIFSNTTATATTASWTNGNGDARAVFIAMTSTGSALPGYGPPYVANTAFGAGSQIGSTGWYCIYKGTGTAVNITGLTATTTYRVTVAEYNEGEGEAYLTTGLNPANVTTPAPAPLATAPTIQASKVLFSNITTAATSVSWTNGNGAARAVFILKGANGSALPVNRTTYAAANTYAIGDQIGTTGWYCIYNGTGTSANVSGLLAGTTYRVTAVEYNGATGAQSYLTTGLSPASVTTVATTPTVPARLVTFTGTTPSSTTVSWTNGSGTARAVFIGMKTSGSALPVDGTAYTANSTFSAGTQAGTNGWYCIYNGSGSSADVDGLLPGTTYRVTVVEYNTNAGTQNYLTTGLSPANVTTINTYPTVPSRLVKFTNTTANSTTVSWTPGNGGQRLAFMELTGTGSVVLPNKSYTPNASFGLGSMIVMSGKPFYCIYSGNGSSVNITGLSPGTLYRVTVVEFNSGGGQYLYLNTGQSPANVTTLPPSANSLYLPGSSATPFVASFNSQKVEANNILSPNGDGINDIWVVKNIAFYPQNTVSVYDHEGKVVFTQKGYINDWAGTYRGSTLSNGTYYYAIDLGNGTITKGFITVVSH